MLRKILSWFGKKIEYPVSTKSNNHKDPIVNYRLALRLSKKKN